MTASGVFRGVPAPFKATRYHSLIVDRATMPRRSRVTADTDDGLVMGAGAQGACPCTACSSIPKASPRSTAT